MQALLLVSNPDERAVLQLILQRVGLAARVASNQDEVLERWPQETADLAILVFDRDVPLAFARQLKGYTAAPMVVVCDPQTEMVHADLLDAGADLVVVRPFSARLLVAQVRALLRRGTGIPFFSLPTVSRGDVALDPSSRTVQVGQEAAKQLTQLEFRLLYTLMMHADQVFPADRLVEHVWGYSGRGDRDLVRGLVRRVRVKIEPEPRSPQYIVTVPRVGYVFRFHS